MESVYYNKMMDKVTLTYKSDDSYTLALLHVPHLNCLVSAKTGKYLIATAQFHHSSFMSSNYVQMLGISQVVATDHTICTACQQELTNNNNNAHKTIDFVIFTYFINFNCCNVSRMMIEGT